MQLQDVCELIIDCEHKTAPTQEVGFPSIRTPNIGRGRFLLDGVNRVSEETYRLWTKRAVPLPGDLIMAREAPVGFARANLMYMRAFAETWPDAKLSNKLLDNCPGATIWCY